MHVSVLYNECNYVLQTCMNKSKRSPKHERWREEVDKAEKCLQRELICVQVPTPTSDANIMCCKHIPI